MNEALNLPKSNRGATGGRHQQLVRPLPKDGVADCPSCGCKLTVKRHNADWTCFKCWFDEVVDNDRELEREITDMLMECADWFGRNPQIKADPRAWQHLAVYWPNDELTHR